jgi:hypothetical protein
MAPFGRESVFFTLVAHVLGAHVLGATPASSGYGLSKEKNTHTQAQTVPES